MKLFNKLVGLLRKSKLKPGPEMGDVKLGDTKEYLAELAKKPIGVNLESSLRGVMYAAYEAAELTAVKFEHNPDKDRFVLSVRCGKTDIIPKGPNENTYSSVKSIIEMIIQIEAEQGRVTEDFSYNMITDTIDRYMTLAAAYRELYSDKGGMATVTFTWRYSTLSNGSKRSSLMVDLDYLRDGSGRMYHTHLTNLASVSGKVVVVG